MSPSPKRIRRHLLKAPYDRPVDAEIRAETESVAATLVAIHEAASEYIALIDRAASYLDMFVFFSDLDFALSRLKFVFADFERAHFSWSRFLTPPEDESPPEPAEDEPIPINGDYLPEDPRWLEVNEKVLGEMKRLMVKRGEEDTFWFFDDPFCDESYLEGEVSSNIAEIYADLVEICEGIEILEEDWDEEWYFHIQDLVEYHTTHHIMVLLRPIQYLIGKDL